MVVGIEMFAAKNPGTEERSWCLMLRKDFAA
jgi:hypothetical protein